MNIYLNGTILWNHAEEIPANEQALPAGGGKFIMYVPKVGVMA